MNPNTDETRLLADAEAALPAVLRKLYAGRLRDQGITEEDGRRFFALNDTAGKRVELRLETAPLPEPRLSRTFTNTTSDRYVVQLSDRMPPEMTGQVLSREVGELLAVRDRSAVGRGAPLDNLLAAGATPPTGRELSDADLGRVGEFNYLASLMTDPAAGGPERQEARDRFSALIDESGLRTGAPATDTAAHALEQYAANIRLDLARQHLTPDARDAMDQLARPAEQLAPGDAQALAAARTARAQDPREAAALGTAPAFPMPGRRADGTPIPREELGQAVAAAAEQRTALSAHTLDQLRAEQATLPEGRYPQREIMIGGGASLAGRDPDVLLVDARGRWHVDPIEAIVQSADQVRHLRESGMGDPYQFADPQQRVPLPALQLWEDTAAARGPLVDGRAGLSIGEEGRLIAEISPADGSPPVRVEVQGSPLVATGIPPEIVPGADRGIPTVPEATGVLAEQLAAAGTPEALGARDRLLALPEGEGRAAASLDVLADPAVAGALGAAGDPRVAGATDTLRATAAWEGARAAAPGRVLMGDEVGDGDYDPQVANEWLIAGVGGAAIANAEIILQANPDATVSMVGKDAPFVLKNDAQYLALRQAHDAALGGDGRLVTYSDRRLGEVGTVTAPDGRVRLAALDDHGRSLGVEGDAYVACLGRVSRLPQALDSVESWARESSGQVRGELMFDKDRQYLGYRLAFEADGRQHTVDVTGAASRMLPGNVFGKEDMARLAVLDAKTAPPESGNVAAGFMATALQGSHLAQHRAAGGGPGGPPASTPPAPNPPTGPATGPATGGPASGAPTAGGPAAGGPTAGTPTAGTRAAGTPAPSGPAPGAPTPGGTAPHRATPGATPAGATPGATPAGATPGGPAPAKAAAAPAAGNPVAGAARLHSGRRAAASGRPASGPAGAGGAPAQPPRVPRAPKPSGGGAPGR
ncbi:hypothetical protein ACFY93_24145 [Streptomyces sp. NPDC008313]|uniref:hypothetical protein n=1 Tax=Streptomyces sp. NPDC008313 TaxID=3364826 RepID=UPI0036F18F84